MTYPQSSDFYFIHKRMADPSASCDSCIQIINIKAKKKTKKNNAALIVSCSI